jgi:hypothetical protein
MLFQVFSLTKKCILLKHINKGKKMKTQLEQLGSVVSEMSLEGWLVVI